MYQRDVNEIKAFVKWRGPDALVNTGLFVLLTIQAGLYLQEHLGHAILRRL
jgi:hypothetical protein